MQPFIFGVRLVGLDFCV